METIFVNDKEFEIVKLLGKGKGGYSYLVKDKNGLFYVVKQIHHEPCSYYTFGNKLESEINDYQRLLKCNILLPKLIEIDYQNERILKEYIDGMTIDKYVESDQMEEDFYIQIKEIAIKVKNNGLNIDYYPTNFVVNDGKLFYIDYECNEYQEKWDYDHWGSTYWYKSKQEQ